MTEEGRTDNLEGLRITERITGGDIEHGYWRWTVREVEGGTEVELYFDADLARGSMVLRSMVRQGEDLLDAMPMQVALSMMGQLIGGRSLRIERPLSVAR